MSKTTLRKLLWKLVFTVLGGILPTIILVHLGYKEGSGGLSKWLPFLQAKPQPSSSTGGQVTPEKQPVEAKMEERKVSSSDAKSFLE